jgi:hypothetical protein
MTHAKALYALVEETDLTLTVDNGCESESSFHSNVTFFADADDPRIPTWEQVHAKFVELQAAEPIRLLRIDRDKLLASSDWRDLPSYAGTKQAEWRTYRQALRDITAGLDTVDKVNAVTWPEKPE